MMGTRRGWLRNAGLVVVLLTSLSLASEEPQAPDRDRLAADRVTPATSDVRALLTRQAQLKHKLAQLAPPGLYLVVDTAHNRLYVKRGRETLLTALASTGSGTILDKPDQPGSQWVFDTPRGEFTIQSKLTNPVWVKPDWAFLEEGLSVPRSRADRVEPGILGDYALGFGKGFFIHGTLYPRLLGKNVTHGCIRLSDEDLRAVYRLAKIGTPLLIF
ncbi:L,D-transpeptidase [Candidatus Nitrospira bockiana]